LAVLAMLCDSNVSRKTSDSGVLYGNDTVVLFC